MIYKCEKGDDCGQSEGLCCVSCESIEECKTKDWTCMYLDNGQKVEDCKYVYLKFE